MAEVLSQSQIDMLLSSMRAGNDAQAVFKSRGEKRRTIQKI